MFNFEVEVSNSSNGGQLFTFNENVIEREKERILEKMIEPKVLNMSESQSRYGIMEELNTKKLQAKQELANLELQTEQGIRFKQEEIEVIKTQVLAQEGGYKSNYLRVKANKESEMRLRKLKHEQELALLSDELKNLTENYELDYQRWKESQLLKIKELTKTLDDFERTQKRIIASKKEMLVEIDAGMKNLKEISKEQKEK